MSHLGVSRLLSKREKHQGRHQAKEKEKTSLEPPFPEDDTSCANFYGLFISDKAGDSHEESKVKLLRRRMMETKSVIMTGSQIRFALRSKFSHGDIDVAFDLLMAMSDAAEGIIVEYDPRVKLLGSENRGGVSCFLDSTLFALFCRLDSFEAMLYNTFEDEPRNRLALLLRLWVNLFRRGKLIKTDITKLIQDSLAECGWVEAGKLEQQDASEAFTFITGKLQLPLLTLKMDLYHTGSEDKTDDHKFINERLLEVAIPSDPSGSAHTITLEDCLEQYFNNRVEIRRYLERRSTMGSTKSFEANPKGSAIHVETVEVDSDSFLTTPLSPSPSISPSMMLSTMQSNTRTPSIIQQRFIPDPDDVDDANTLDVDGKRPLGGTRNGSIRKEVVIPAWQFFSLIPWYTDNTPTSDTQVAAHFSSKRPVLGLCLKRYAMTPNGKAIRLNTHVDIPVEIGLPHFIQDDNMADDGPLYGNFKLSLQSVVCHRGTSVSSGHYIALARGTNLAAEPGSRMATEDTKHWMRFDDLALKRITLVDIEETLKEETPYLLFYQIVPIEGDPGHITVGEQFPAYASSEARDSGVAGISLSSLSQMTTREEAPSSLRTSFEIDKRGRSPILGPRRASLTVATPLSLGDGSGGTEHNQDKIPPPRSSSWTRRPPSKVRSGGERLATSLSRLSMAGRRSKEALPAEVPAGPEVVVREISNVTSGSPPAPPPAHVATFGHAKKEGKRAKSKNRLSKSPGRPRGEKPDRECMVM